MAFGNDSKPARIYSYGALPPDREDLVLTEMRLANRYRNDLVELERSRRARSLEAMRARFPEVPALEAEAEALREQIASAEDEIKRRNAAARRRRATAEERAGLRGLRERRKAVYADLKARKATAWADPGLQEDLAGVEEWATAEKKALRARYAHPPGGEGPALYCGTYLTVEAALQRARRGAPPVFRGFRGEGKVSVQLQRGLSVPDLFGCTNNHLRLEAQDANKRHYLLWLRVGSTGRDPVWAKAPVILHRDLPAAARVKWAYLLRRRRGSHFRWEAQLVLARDEWETAAAAGGACGVDLGWRLVPAGLRVAYWAGDDGRSGELIIPRDDLGRWSRVESLSSTRDTNFNVIRDALAAWLRATTAAVPDWLREALAYLPQWRSPARLAALLWRWNGVFYRKGREIPWQPFPAQEGPAGCGRFLGDEDIFPRLWAWRRQDRHLLDWQENTRQRAVRWRDDLYRRFARELAGRYHTLIFEKVNWRELQEQPPADGEARLWTTNHRIAAVGRLRQFVREKAGDFQEADPAHTTQRCHACGSLEDFDAARELEHACSGCGQLWDQDFNAAKNLLQALAASGSNAGAGA
jgi:hypothetical protein